MTVLQDDIELAALRVPETTGYVLAVKAGKNITLRINNVGTVAAQTQIHALHDPNSILPAEAFEYYFLLVPGLHIVQCRCNGKIVVLRFVAV